MRAKETFDRIDDVTNHAPDDPRLPYIDMCLALGREEVATRLAADVPPGVPVERHIEEAMRTWLPGFRVSSGMGVEG